MGKKRQPRAKPNKFLSDDERCSDLFWSYYEGQFGWSEAEATLCKEALSRELPATFRVTGFREQSKEVLWLIKNKFLEGLIAPKSGEIVPKVTTEASDDVKEVVSVAEIEEEREPRESQLGPAVFDRSNDGFDANMATETLKEGQKDAGDAQFLRESQMETAFSPGGAPLAKPLPWYPNEMAWQLNASKIEIRKTPELKKLHKFLISETDCGFISRQEAVSMIPPLLLDIESHHKVLDLCAAPGSKTAQLLEMLHSNSDTTPTGIVVANDIDNKRCYMMVHQLQRLQSPCVVVVRQDASIFPKMYLPNSLSKSGQSPMLFDRILADVPCSGDGTLRKNPDLWPRWNPNLGVNEHFLQIKILRRSLEMLTEGGRMVYSTCSLNPLEDEAVIASVLAQCKGSVQLIDIGEKLPSLIATKGLTNWKVMLKNKTWCTTQDDVPFEQRRSFRSTLFPPANIDELHIDRCRRVFPQLQNTGGFFIALLEKISCLPWMNAAKSAQNATFNSTILTEESSITNDTNVNAEKSEDDVILNKDTNSNADVSNGPVKKKARIFKEDPFYYIEDSDVSWEKVKSYYDINNTFPHKQLMYRNADGKRRNYYFTNDLVKQLVQSNVDTGINFVNLGVKAFGISEDKVFQGYRLLQEGLEIVEPYIGASERRMAIKSRSDLLNLLAFDMPLICTFSKALNDEFTKFSVGPVLFQYDPLTDDSGAEMPRIPLVFAGWRGFSSLRHYVGVHERSHLLRLCGEEPIDVVQASRWDELDDKEKTE